MRKLWPLTLRGTGALVLAIVCVIVANQLGVVELVWFGVLLLALLTASLLTVLARRGAAEVERLVSPAVPAAGDELTVTTRIRARSALPAAGSRWRDALPEGIEGTAAGLFPAVASRLSRQDREAVVTYRATAKRRGIHWIGPLDVATTDPFGVARRTAALGESTRLVVTPAVVELPSITGLPGRSGGMRSTPMNRLGQGTDDVIARPWAPGDSMRRIHWRASAHRDELMVRQEEQESSPEATIVLDRAAARFSPAAMESAGTDPAFERAVVTCASALARLSDDGYVVTVIDTDGTVLCAPVEPTDAAAREAAMLALATVQARQEDRLLALVPLFAGDTTGPLVLVTGALSLADAVALTAVGHHSTFPVLLATDPEPGALAGATGWTTGLLGADVSSAWNDAVSARLQRAGA